MHNSAKYVFLPFIHRVKEENKAMLLQEEPVYHPLADRYGALPQKRKLSNAEGQTA